jgi:hypothetical protein
MNFLILLSGTKVVMLLLADYEKYHALPITF